MTTALDDLDFGDALMPIAAPRVITRCQHCSCELGRNPECKQDCADVRRTDRRTKDHAKQHGRVVTAGEHLALCVDGECAFGMRSCPARKR